MPEQPTIPSTFPEGIAQPNEPSDPEPAQPLGEEEAPGQFRPHRKFMGRSSNPLVDLTREVIQGLVSRWPKP